MSSRSDCGASALWDPDTSGPRTVDGWWGSCPTISGVARRDVGRPRFIGERRLSLLSCSRPRLQPWYPGHMSCASARFNGLPSVCFSHRSGTGVETPWGSAGVARKPWLKPWSITRQRRTTPVVLCFPVVPSVCRCFICVHLRIIVVASHRLNRRWLHP